MLPAGSRAELRDDARLSTEFTAGVRRVVLDRGEAHFEVQKDPARPFVVVAGRLEVRAVSGDLQTSGFRGQQRLHTVSGDHRIVEAGGTLEVHSVSGDVSLRAVADIDVNVDTVSGDLSAEAPTIDRLDVNAVSGDVSVDGALGHGPHAIDTVSGDVRLATSSGVTVSVRGLASDIHSSLPHRIEGSADLRRLIVGDGAAPLAFSSMSGDLSVTHSRQAPSKPAGRPPVQGDGVGSTPYG